MYLLYLLKKIPGKIKAKFKTIPLIKTIYERINIVRGYKEYLKIGQDNYQLSKPGFQGKVKRGLLSYLTAPLQYPKHKRNRSMFSNFGIAQCIPRALNELGYEVDIVHCYNTTFIPQQKYDLFIGHGGTNFEVIARRLPPEITKIYFSTGIYWKTWNEQEERRFQALWQRRGCKLPPDRFITASEEYANTTADGIICLGNEFALETYRKFPLVINLNNAVFPVEYDITLKDYEYGRHGFLFFNGPGNVHKGLDLLLEAFSRLKQHLYVCQAIEPKFAKVYKKELNGCPNIHVIGYIPMRSSKFYEAVNKCNFVISPTCAEGQPGSIIECMAHGLIPILSREANIDIEDFGILLKDNTIEEIIDVVEDVSQKSAEWCKERARLVVKEINENYTEDKFLQNMKRAIWTVMQKKDKDISEDMGCL